jgi:hypothetical protein
VKFMAKKVAEVRAEVARMIFGTIWLVDDVAQTITEHLGSRRPALHIGPVFKTHEEALGVDRMGYQTNALNDVVRFPNQTPVPMKKLKQQDTKIPERLFIVAFDDLLGKGLRVEQAPIASVEFGAAPAHLMGQVDFVATAAIAGDHEDYRVVFEYDYDCGLNIVESPEILTLRGHVPSKQHLVFFDRQQAFNEADAVAASLASAGNWRSRVNFI